MITKKASTIRPLTGLRFFASAAIVYLHIGNSYGLTPIAFPLGNGVMLFFALSGFILTYVYPSINNINESISFIKARFARIWPIHLTCLLLTIILYVPWQSSFEQNRIALLNFLLLHAWIPILEFPISFNSVSWTISVEFFFYAIFPLLIFNFSRTWHWKLALAFCLSLMMCGLAAYWTVPMMAGGSEISGVTLLSIFPPSRLFEFVAGMACCLAWRHYAHRMPKSFVTASVIEIGLVAFIAWFGYQVGPLSLAIGVATNTYFGGWLNFGPAFLPFALALLFILAAGNGILSWILSTKIFVFLGEISFATYMVHQIVQNFFIVNFDSLNGLPHGLALSIYLTTTFVASCLLHFVVERPMRDLIVGRKAVLRIPKPA